MYDIISESEKIAQNAWNYQGAIDRIASRRDRYWDSYFKEIEKMPEDRWKYWKSVSKGIEEQIAQTVAAKWKEWDRIDNLKKVSGLNFQYLPESDSLMESLIIPADELRKEYSRNYKKRK